LRIVGAISEALMLAE